MHEITVPWAKLQFPDRWPDTYEQEMWNETTCPEGGTAIDVGAHYGFYTTKMAREAGAEGKVLAFEPNEINRGFLEKNLKQNDLTASVLNCALSDYDGTGKLFTYGQQDNDSGKNFLRGSSNHEAFYAEYHQGKPAAYPQYDSQVRVTTLDRVAADLLRVDLIKMDVWGAELNVLEGGKLTLKKHMPRIVVEVHFNQLESLKSLLDSHGYHLARYYQSVTHSSNPSAVFEKK